MVNQSLHTLISQIVDTRAGVSTICTLLGGTLGPVLATSLFQWSISLEFAGGNLIWILMFVVCEYGRLILSANLNLTPNGGYEASISTIHAFTLRPPDRVRRTLPEESVVLHSVDSLGGSRSDWAD